MIQMETSLLEARCRLRMPLKGPSPGINQWPRPRGQDGSGGTTLGGVAMVSALQHRAAVVLLGARPPATLPQPPGASSWHCRGV